METADVIVIGGGVMGTSIAFNLARRRAGRVVLLEKNTVCSGTSAKSSAIVRTHYTTRPTAVMALLARGIFERWADEVGGESGFVRTGMLFVGPPESRERVQRTLRMNQEVGIEASLIGPDEVREISPHLRIPEGAAVVYEPRSGYGSPHEVASSFARRFTELGGQLRQSTPVTAIDTHGGRVRAVRTPAGGDRRRPRRDRRWPVGATGRAAGRAGPAGHAQPGIDRHAPAGVRLEPRPPGHRGPGQRGVPATGNGRADPGRQHARHHRPGRPRRVRGPTRARTTRPRW